MLKLYLVRHGETEWNATQRVQGVSDIPLSETGRAQARAVADALGERTLTAVYSSDLSRASETADHIAAAHGLSVQLRPALREMHQGELEGMVFADVMRDYPDLMSAWMESPADVVMPGGGESLQQVHDRAWPVLEDIIAAHDSGRVAIVSHALTLRSILTEVLGLPLNQCRSFHIDTAGVTHVEVNGRMPGTVVRTLNATEHLRTVRKQNG